jgi:hypothetical protein
MPNYFSRAVASNSAGGLLVDEVLALIAVKRTIMIQEIQEMLSPNSLTTSMVLEFLVRFGFAKLAGQSVMPSKSSESFLETTGR